MDIAVLKTSKTSLMLIMIGYAVAITALSLELILAFAVPEALRIFFKSPAFYLLNFNIISIIGTMLMVKITEEKPNLYRYYMYLMVPRMKVKVKKYENGIAIVVGENSLYGNDDGEMFMFRKKKDIIANLNSYLFRFRFNGKKKLIGSEPIPYKQLRLKL